MIKPNILIVDDISFNIIALKALLEYEDYNIFEANSGAECLSILLKEKIDIILMDVQMPDMDGFETAKYIRQNSRTKLIPIIFITAARETETFNLKGYESGAIDIIYKPINKDILIHKLSIFVELIIQRVTLQQQIKELQRLNEANEKMRKRIESLALQDYLTGLDNRRKVDDNLENYYNNAFRSKEPISVLMIDIDNFKLYNDHFGHTDGDEVLKQVATALRQSVSRPMDCTGRFGGEEFIVILPDTNQEGAKKVAEKIIGNIRNMNIPHAPKSPKNIVTLSIGIATEIPDMKDQFIQFLDYADKALYNAKNSGKDTYKVFNG